MKSLRFLFLGTNQTVGHMYIGAIGQISIFVLLCGWLYSTICREFSVDYFTYVQVLLLIYGDSCACADTLGMETSVGMGRVSSLLRDI